MEAVGQFIELGKTRWHPGHRRPARPDGLDLIERWLHEFGQRLIVLGGLSFGTLMTLYLMPVLYYGFNRYREKRDAKRAPSAPAASR